MCDMTNFLAWLLEDMNDVSAVVGTPRDSQLKEFADKGFLRYTETFHGTNQYEITGKWCSVLQRALAKQTAEGKDTLYGETMRDG